jgi:adenosine deaminase
VMAAIRGLDRASLEYPQVRAGLILMMDRTFSDRQNQIIVEKALRYAPRGVVGIDIAGPRPTGGRYPYRDLAPLLEEARAGGLGVTIHVGEEGGEHGAAEVGEVVETLRPDRIGHGILAAREPELMAALRELGIVLEVCPTSNVATGVFERYETHPLRTLHEAGVKLTLGSDDPPYFGATIGGEYAVARKRFGLEEGELKAITRTAVRGSFADDAVKRALLNRITASSDRRSE